MWRMIRGRDSGKAGVLVEPVRVFPGPLGGPVRLFGTGLR